MKIYTKHGNAELYSIDSRHYFGNNGTLHILTEDQLHSILTEIQDMRPNIAIAYIDSKCVNFKKI